MRSFLIGSGDAQTFQAGNYVGLDIALFLQHVSVNTAFAGQPFDLTKVQVKLTLSRGGKDFDLFNDVAYPLIAATSFYAGIYDETKLAGAAPTLRRVQVAGAAVKEQLLISAKILLPSIINLNPGDQLRCELNSQVSAVNAVLVDTTASQIRWQLIEGVGNSYSIPKVRAKAITQGMSSTDETLGDHVQSIFYINNDKSTVLTADQVITLAQITSDKLTRTMSYEQLFEKRSREFVTAVAADSRSQSFNIFNMDLDAMHQAYDTDDIRLHKVGIHFNFNAPNVNSGTNWLVWTGYYADTLTAAVASARKEKHDDLNAGQYTN